MNNSTTESDVQHEDYWCPLLTSGVINWGIDVWLLVIKILL